MADDVVGFSRKPLSQLESILKVYKYSIFPELIRAALSAIPEYIAAPQKPFIQSRCVVDTPSDHVMQDSGSLVKRAAAATV
jgi:hypothetical protein